MATQPLTLELDSEPARKAIGSLADLAERSPEVVEGFFNTLDSLEEIFRIDGSGGPATGTNQLWVVLQPTDRLVNFLATAGAGNV